MRVETRLPHYTPLHCFLLELRQGRTLFFKTRLLFINHPRIAKKNISLSGLLPSLFTLVLELWMRMKG